MSHAPTGTGGGGNSAPTQTSNNNPSVKGAPAWTFGLIFLLVSVAFGYQAYKGGNNTANAQQQHYRPAPVIQVPRPCETRASFRTFEIPQEGLPLHLCQGWRTYPLGGGITITNPEGKVLRDAPGITVNFGWQPTGIYVFRTDPPGSKRSVEIYAPW